MRSLWWSLCLATTLFSQTLPLYFEGNTHISDRTLYETVGLDQPYFYEFWRKDPAVEISGVALLSETIEIFYRSRGFFHVIVSVEKSSERSVIRIEENAPIRISDIQSISQLDLSAAIGLKEGDIFDAELFAESKKAVRNHYAEQGYCNAQLDAKAWIDIETDRAYLLYEVTPQHECRFGTVSIQPPPSVEEWIIVSQLDFEEGEPFSLEAVRRSYSMLSTQEGLSSVRIDTKSRKGHIVPVSVSVDENPKPVRTKLGAGYSSDEGALLQVGVKHANLYGNLKSLGAEARYSEIRQSVTALYSMPLTPLHRFGMEAGFKEEQFEGYRDQSLYLKAFLQQREARHAFEEALIFDRTKIYASDDETVFPENILFIVSPSLQWHYDRRDRLLEPTKGYFVRVNVMGSSRSSVSDATYFKGALSGGYLYAIDDSVIGVKAKLGSLRVYDGRIPASYRFYAGGMNSNRAYRYRMLGPRNEDNDPIGFNSLAEGSLEYRFPVYGEFRGVVFSDMTFIGQEYAPDANKAYTAVGAGIRYKTPIGPIAFDAGIDIEDPAQYAIHFHIGELF